MNEEDYPNGTSVKLSIRADDTYVSVSTRVERHRYESHAKVHIPGFNRTCLHDLIEMGWKVEIA